MYDLERIGKIIADIDRYQKELKDYSITSVNQLYDSKTYHATSMILFGILNRTLDLGSELISAEHLGAPASYRDIMLLLAKAGVMNIAEAERLNELIAKRNVLAHFYEDMAEKDVLALVKKIELITSFVTHVKKRVGKHL